MKLLLFDIDGTLVNAFGAGREAVEAAIQEVTGRPINADGLPFSGKTDPQITREMLEREGIDGNLDALTTRVLRRYADRLAALLPQRRTEALPGTQALLSELSDRDDVLLGLLTGNLERTAYLKLEAAGLADFFDFGAFGSDDANRNHLPSIAARRAADHTGQAFSGTDLIVIGDTPLDVACGDAHGTRTVGISTGRYDRAALEDAGADVVFDDLSDADRFIRAMLEEET